MKVFGFLLPLVSGLFINQSVNQSVTSNKQSECDVAHVASKRLLQLRWLQPLRVRQIVLRTDPARKLPRLRRHLSW